MLYRNKVSPFLFFISFLIILGVEKVSWATALNIVGGIAYPSFPLSPSGMGHHTRTYVYGALIDYRVARKAEVQWGLLYSQRGYKTSVSQYTFNSLEFPLQLKFLLTRLISFGLGGYFSHALGSISVEPEPGPGTTTSLSYSAASLVTDDYGFLTTLGLKIPFMPGGSIVLDARYLIGMRNINLAQGGKALFLQDVQVLAGVRFGH